MPDKIVTTTKGLTTKHVILILGSLIIISASVIATVLLLQDKETPSVQTPVINESNLKSITDDIKEKVAKGMFQTHMNTTWVFNDGKSPSTNAVMGNSSANTYPFWFTLSLPDTGDILYKSAILPLGTQIDKITLEKDLDKGEYQAVATIHMVDENGAEVETNVGFNITLQINN